MIDKNSYNFFRKSDFPKMIPAKIRLFPPRNKETWNTSCFADQICEAATETAADNFLPSFFFPPSQSSSDHPNGFSALQTLANSINILTKLFAADAFME